MARAYLIPLLAATVQSLSCSAAAPPTTAGASPGLPCDVDAVLARSCRSCHGDTPSFGAPMPLVSWEHLHAVSASGSGKKVYELVGQRVHDDAHPMPQPPAARLGQADSATLDQWIAAGGPRASGASGATCPDAGRPAQNNGLSCTTNVHMAPDKPFAMPTAASDLYQCYGFDLPVANKQHLVGISPLVDNPSIIHHLVLYQADRSTSSTPGPCDLANLSKWRLMYGWAPGVKSFEFPAEAGYPVEGTAHFVVQIHYNNIKHAAGQTDASGFDFCTTGQLRPNDADAMVFGGESFTLPAHAATTLSCSYQLPPGTHAIHAFSAEPHMHQLGTHIATRLLPLAGGPPVDLGARDNWDFNNQYYVPISATLLAGDTVKIDCGWNNTTDQPVSFGPLTANEMCFSYTMYYPRITDSSWNWRKPALESVCVSQ